MVTATKGGGGGTDWYLHTIPDILRLLLPIADTVWNQWTQENTHTHTNEPGISIQKIHNFNNFRNTVVHL